MRKKLLFSVLSAFMLSLCIASCSKDDDVQKVPVTKEGVIGEWTISGNPAVSVVINAYADKAQQVKDTLDYLFKAGDKYQFNDNESCVITRRTATAPHPNTYNIAGGHLTFDGYIKFLTDISADNKTITLTAGVEEIRGIVRKELEKPQYKLDAAGITAALKLVTGEVKLILKKN